MAKEPTKPPPGLEKPTPSPPPPPILSPGACGLDAVKRPIRCKSVECEGGHVRIRLDGTRCPLLEIDGRDAENAIAFELRWRLNQVAELTLTERVK